MRKILVVQRGSRVNGNTAQLVSHFLKGAEESGHIVKTISLVKNEVKGCLGCNACHYGKPCVRKYVDCIVFASLLYFWMVSSWIKAFIERFYCKKILFTEVNFLTKQKVMRSGYPL